MVKRLRPGALIIIPKSFSSPKLQPGEKVILEIPAAALSARVFLNGEEIGSHEGGFSSFSVDLTKQLFRPSENTAQNRLTITVNNENQSNIYPQMADFTFYGGLYRGARLLILPPVHFATGSFGESSLRVRTSLPAEKLAKLSLHSQITPASADYTIRYCIVDQSGLCVAESWRPADNPDTEILLPEPVLWQGVENPYLYHCRAALVYRNEVVDEISTTFGIRSFSVDSRLGFCLNGKPVMLRGGFPPSGFPMAGKCPFQRTALRRRRPDCGAWRQYGEACPLSAQRGLLQCL